jgi:hypothetical protein
MKKEDLKVNAIFYSTRFKCMGKCFAVMDFMAYMVFLDRNVPSGWYHCSELTEDFTDIKDIS